MSVHWIIQGNLGKSQDTEALSRAARAQGHEVTLTRVIPFSDELADYPAQGPTLFYGSTRWTSLIAQSGRWSPGVYFDEQRFSYSRYLHEYRGHMLNEDAVFLTIEQAAQLDDEDETPFFVRPDGDMKSFAGEVMTQGALQRWAARVLDVESPVLPAHTMILMASVAPIDREWRLFVVDGQVATSTRYRNQGRVEPLAEQPEDVLEFAQPLIEAWAPAPAFVMDIAASQGQLRVIECNGIHSSGFYAANISAFVRAMSALAIKDASQ